MDSFALITLANVLEKSAEKSGKIPFSRNFPSSHLNLHMLWGPMN